MKIINWSNSSNVYENNLTSFQIIFIKMNFYCKGPDVMTIIPSVSLFFLNYNFAAMFIWLCSFSSNHGHMTSDSVIFETIYGFSHKFIWIMLTTFRLEFLSTHIEVAIFSTAHKDDNVKMFSYFWMSMTNGIENHKKQSKMKSEYYEFF